MQSTRPLASQCDEEAAALAGRRLQVQSKQAQKRAEVMRMQAHLMTQVVDFATSDFMSIDMAMDQVQVLKGVISCGGRLTAHEQRAAGFEAVDDIVAAVLEQGRLPVTQEQLALEDDLDADLADVPVPSAAVLLRPKPMPEQGCIVAQKLDEAWCRQLRLDANALPRVTLSRIGVRTAAAPMSRHGIQGKHPLQDAMVSAIGDQQEYPGNGDDALNALIAQVDEAEALHVGKPFLLSALMFGWYVWCLSAVMAVGRW